MTLYRVYTQTVGDKSVSERIVEANSIGEARDKAVGNVKGQNPGKGDKSQAESQADTRVLAAKRCGKNGVLTINRFPLAVVDMLMHPHQGEEDEGGEEDEEDEEETSN